MDDESDNRKKGRLKRFGGMTVLVAAIILILLRMLLPLVSPASLSTAAVLCAMGIAAIVNLLYERREKS